MGELKGKLYDFNKRRVVSEGGDNDIENSGNHSKKDGDFFKIESRADYERLVGETKRKQKEEDARFDQEMQEKINKIKAEESGEVPYGDVEKLSDYMHGKPFIHQKAILEKALEEKIIDIDQLIALYNSSKEGQTRAAVIENISIIPGLSEEEKKKAIEFLSAIKFDSADESMFFGEDFFQPKDELSAQYLARYYNYHYETDDNESWNILNGARVSSLLKFGYEGERKVLDFFDDLMFGRDGVEHEEYLFKDYLLRELKELGGYQSFSFITEKISSEKLDFEGYRSLIDFLESDKDKFCQAAMKRLATELTAEELKPLMIAATEIFGAEEWRDKLNAGIIENKIKENQLVLDNLEKARAFITPNDDKEAIFNLQKFYQDNIRFEQYKVNEAMNEKEASLLKSLIDKNGKNLEMGCGTGRLMKELVKDGYDLTGYDFTARHVEITKTEIEKSGGEAKVFQGDWHENAVKDESLDAVYSLGRNILHDYSIADQAQLFREASRILKKGGKFIFDIPDREKGGYAQMVKGYAEEMEKRGIRNFRFGSIYDSPDGVHFATRYAYSHEDIEELARMGGFRIADIKRLPLETGQGDENLYYVLEKI